MGAERTGRGQSTRALRQDEVDSDVERTFVANNLKERGDVALLYFKFPPKFKINLPKIINNYNPDWGIVRQINESVINLEIVVETKGGSDIGRLRFAGEAQTAAPNGSFPNSEFAISTSMVSNFQWESLDA